MMYYDDPAWIYQKYITEFMPMAQISKIMGMRFGAVRDRLIKFKIPIRNRKEAQGAQAKRSKVLYHNKNWLSGQYLDQRRSISDIAKQFSVSTTTIFYWLKKRNVRIKTKTESRIGHVASETARENMSKAQVGRHHPESVKRKIGDAQRGEKNHLWGKKLTEDHIAKLRQATLDNWQDSNFVEKTLRRLGARPTTPERELASLAPELRYTGNGSWWRMLPNGKHKNPDFKVPHQNKVVEVYGDYWHRNDDPQELINLYKQVGIDCLVIWEKEIKKTPEIVSEKIAQFISQ